VITPARNQNCTMTAKTAPRFAPDRLIKIVTKTRNPADALWSTQRRLLTLTAGPLALMSGSLPVDDKSEKFLN
jgi:hypothetical protein